MLEGTRGSVAASTLATSANDLASEVRARSDQRTWREEVALRVDRHRARHRRDDHASMELDFPAEGALAVTSAPIMQSGLAPTLGPSPSPKTESVIAPSIAETVAAKYVTKWDAAPAIQLETHVEEPPARVRPRKVIRFPKNVESERLAPLITEIELAEPPPEPPRIMDAPAPPAEQMELLPSFADMHLDEEPGETLLDDLELPMRAATLGQRLASGLFDGAIVAGGLMLFLWSFGKIVTGSVPVRTELLAILATGGILWLLYQYLFLTYNSGTPGMRAAQLELSSFAGGKASLRARRSRALASGLSALSVGLGFAWALVDEDTLGWPDRISQTYLKRASHSSKFEQFN
jgi:uncharacterized RDD family membrane protein YckC